MWWAGMKPQTLQLINVFVVGPLTLVAAQANTQPVVRIGLTLSALLTIVYNGSAYLEERARGR